VHETAPGVTEASPRTGDAGRGGPADDPAMGCLLAIFAGMFPRFAVIIFWIARPNQMDAIFTSFVWPVLGIIFLPFTTLIYILLYDLPFTGVSHVGVTGWDWLWIGLAVFLDLSHWAASANQRNQRSFA
jgi:hypothetical protein